MISVAMVVPSLPSENRDHSGGATCSLPSGAIQSLFPPSACWALS